MVYDVQPVSDPKECSVAKNLQKLKSDAMQQALKGKLDKALKLYQQIVEQDPKDIKTWVKIGDLYKKMGRSDQAIDIYQKAARSFALGGFLMQAISVNKMILELDPEHEETQQALAELYSRKEGAEDSGKGGGAVSGASSNVLEMLKKKPGADKPAEKEPTPPPAEVAEEEESAEEPATSTSAKPQFDALDLDMADDLFDQIMEQEDVEIETEDDAEQLLAKLPEIPLFSHLNQDEFLGIVEHLELRRFDVDDHIIKEGEPGDAFYIIGRGEAKVTKQDPRGKEIEITTIGEGDFFGEFAFFSESERHASVTVTQEMDALEIDRLKLAELIGQFPRIQDVMKEFYKERLIGTMMKISPLFQPLSDEDRKAVLKQFEELEAPVGSVLIRQGEEGDGLYCIVAGEIAVTVKGAEGKAVEVARLREGDFFGEISLITDQPTTANCIAVKTSQLYKLPKAAFKDVIAQYPQILEVAADYADERVKETKKMVSGGEENLQKAGVI